MYLEISQAADPQLVGRIYTILEVLGTNQLRLDYEQDIQAIFQYRILRDTKADLINTERFINEFQTKVLLYQTRWSMSILATMQILVWWQDRFQMLIR